MLNILSIFVQYIEQNIMEYRRPVFKSLKKRINEKRKFIQVITGPRQVGKTTLVQQLMKDINTPFLYASADSITTYSPWISQIWESARIKLKNNSSSTFILVIDEIQKIENWSEQVKAEWDKDTMNNTYIKVILLGSSRLLLQQGLTESLAGRFETIHLTHWSYNEINDAFGWDPVKFAWFGGYPGAVELVNNEKRWKEYINDSLIETTISRDILMLTKIDKPVLLKNLFFLGCRYSGQILSFNKILGQLHDAGNTTTLSHYLNLLDVAGLLGGIEKYHKEIFRKKNSSPKFQVYNTALISSQSNETLQEVKKQPEKWGRIIESTVGAHLINSSKTEGFELYYWRHQNNEIDFVIEYKGKIIGLEVKSGKIQKISGLNAFQKMFKVHKVLLVGSQGITWQEFIKMNPLELF